ncbi:MAG: hypothetical protein J4478_00530 [Candidatus Diapherotrites archaeon]|uniref:Uncharacterized protein n=1 Tax=Candidatus Iainarchaeum sp. TaxID=3101447 RepID=A0A7J4KRR3_9ARCH|nr:hypothetical protein [Candidatus Diapherotrites archaeon]HIH21372.1 hypothetical protein [Candidatus Diapherotrites archaeon]HIH32693.1 hypothetical protein [Candidatus Diapherotrites archaeon]
MTTLKIVKTAHFQKYHERFVPWSLVVETIFTGRQKRKGHDFIEFKGRSIYVFCKQDRARGVLKVINAKRLEK